MRSRDETFSDEISRRYFLPRRGLLSPNAAIDQGSAARRLVSKHRVSEKMTYYCLFRSEAKDVTNRQEYESGHIDFNAMMLKIQ